MKENDMKGFTLICSSVLMVVAVALSGSTAVDRHPDKGSHAVVVGSVELTLQNKCTRDVKYLLKSGATSNSGVVPKEGKVKVTVAVGTEICIDGDAFMHVADGDAGQTFIVCR